MTLRYLLNTCVIAEFVRPQPKQTVVDWLNSVEIERVHLSVVTLW